MALNLEHQTAAQFASRFWAALRGYRAIADDESAGQYAREKARHKFYRMIWWLYNRVQAGDFTSNDVRLSFNAAYGRNLNAAQWNSFVTNTLLPIRDRYQAMLDQADI